MSKDDIRCLGKRNMIDSDVDGGFETEKKSPATANISERLPKIEESVNLVVDLYSQAFKALSDRSPFDSAEVLANTSPTLPSVLASLSSRNSDSRKKHKRHHGETKSSRKSSEKSKKSNIWVELEGYFRELTRQDVERLFHLCRSFSSVDGINPCLTVPVLDNVVRKNDDHCNNKLDNDNDGDVVRIEDDIPVENVVDQVNGHVEKECVSGAGPVEMKEEEVGKIENESRDSSSEVKQGLVSVSSTQSCSSIEWVLGSRSRVLLTTTRPTKKRKLLGENAGLERLMVARPCEGSSSLCHICSVGDTGDLLNRLVICKTCEVAVHQKCYGVQGEVNESWTCSLCKHKSDSGHASSSVSPCVLCPKSGGASKQIQRAGSEGSVEFAHLFCCQWIPEVHIGDTRIMEPVLSVDGIKDVRAKLVCNLCKIKLGSCVRCSDGSCRTSFHPICAREARNKLEIWGKFGCDDIELRTFCSRHSEDATVSGSDTLERKELSDSVGGDSLAISVQQGNKIKKLKISCKNGDKVTTNTVGAEANTTSAEENVSPEVMLKDMKTNIELNSGSGDPQGLPEVKPHCQKFKDRTQYFDLVVVLKKLLNRGKVSLEQIASEFSITEDSLAAKLAGNHLGAELSCKILKWLQDHAYTDTSEKDAKAKISRLLPLKAELSFDDHADAVDVVGIDMPDVVPVKSVPPRRRTVGNIVKEEQVIPLWNNELLGNDDSDEGAEHKQIMVETIGLEHPIEEPLPASESTFLKSVSHCDSKSNVAEEVSLPGRRFSLELDQDRPSCSVNAVGRCDGDLWKVVLQCRDLEPGAESLVHPYIKKKLKEVQRVLAKTTPLESYGGTEIESSAIDQPPIINDNEGELSPEVKLEDLLLIKKMGIVDLSPDNEVEGEIIFSQQRLLCNAVTLKRRSDQLVYKVVRSLPNEMDAVRKRRWDDVLVNKYINELKEARKQSRKERRYKEAQAVLAAATAAVATSTRVSSLRKDVGDESSQQENLLKVGNSRIRGGLPPLSVPRPKVFNSNFDVPKDASDGYPDMFQYSSVSPKENLKSCDICRRTESLLNPVLVCLSCKVAVHLNCYRSVKESTGPWYCELCEESSSSVASRNISEKSYPIVECGLCGASNGALRKSSNSQWIHAICAEWVFDSTYRRGQVSAVAGVETVLKGNDICSVCHRKFGVCIRCNSGSCQVTFHPSCARSAGYYLYTKYVGEGKMQHKAYCSKHSLEQKGKAETQKHGAEDLKIVKQHRVELEKLRLLCERIVKREKLKRELIICNYDILATRRDSLPLSILARRPFMQHEGSSESATTSLKGHSRSCSEAMQKSDDVTVDSALSSKRLIRIPLSVDNDQKREDSSASQRIITPKSAERAPFAGKQLPVRTTMTRRNYSGSGDKMLHSRKINETLGKEMLMTSDQATSRNSRLPKGYFYVPLNSLSNEKQVSHDSTNKDDADG